MLPKEIEMKNIVRSEKAITKEIRTYLEREGWFVWKNHGGPMSQAGLPDLMAVRNGYFIAIEVKNSRGSVTPMQSHFLKKLQEQGFNAFVARSAWEVAERLKINHQAE